MQVGAVVVGFDRRINYYKIQYACLCIRENPGCLFIATNLDAVTHLTDAQEWAGNGAMVGAIKGILLFQVQYMLLLSMHSMIKIAIVAKLDAVTHLTVHWSGPAMVGATKGTFTFHSSKHASVEHAPSELQSSML